MHLKGKDWRRFCGKKAAPRRPEWPSYGNFRNVTQDPHFLKRCKGGTNGKFSNIAEKVAFVWKAKKHSGANGIIPELVSLKVQRLENILVQNAAPKVPDWQRYGNFSKVTLNPHFLKKCKGGTKKNFSKIAQKVALLWKAQKHTGANGIFL